MLEFQDKKKCQRKNYWLLQINLISGFFFFQLDRTALHWASANGNIDVIEKLVEDGADLESKDKVHFNVGKIVGRFRTFCYFANFLLSLKMN